MELLIAKNVTRLVGGQALFAPVDLRLRDGDRLGLVGANGSGKSTLLRLLAGLEQPDEGTVSRAPGVRLALLPQRDPAPSASESESSVMAVALSALEHVRMLEAGLRREEERIAGGEDRGEAYAALSDEHERSGGYRASSRLREYLAALDFIPSDHDRPVGTLSAGQRRRLALAQVLSQAPDILLLDEPTNHLDIHARSWLAARLAAWPGALVVVSHDRALLAASTQHTAFLAPERQLSSTARSRLQLESGHYDVAKLRLEALHRSDDRRDQLRRKEVARLDAMASELRGFGHKAVARRARAERQRDELRSQAQPDANSRPSTRFTGARLSAGAQAPRTAPGVLLEARNLALQGVIVATDVRLEAGQRVALLGANGSGKSTLLGLLSGAIPASDAVATDAVASGAVASGDVTVNAAHPELRFRPGLKLRHLDQLTRGVADDVSALEQARIMFGNVTAGRLLAGAGLAPSAWPKLPAQLSGGERAGVGLALTLNQDADLWFLDEPSNDLDLDAVEALEAELEAKLAATGAALVLATHDRHLAERLCSEFWGLRDGELERYADLNTYLAGRPLPSSAARGPVPDESAAAAPPLDDAAASRGPAAATEVAAAKSEDPARLEELEDERTELLRRLSEQVNLSERERRRSQERVRWLESELMVAYSARLPPPAPSFRLLEGGVTFFADDLSALDTNTPTAPAAGAAQRFGLVAARDPSAAAATLANLAARVGPGEGLGEGCLAAWLELRLVERICHLRLLESRDACLLPAGRAALVDAGTRLAFTRLGATAVQLFWHEETLGDSLGASLRPAGDGWWALGLGEFLTSEGWVRKVGSGRGDEAPSDGARKRTRRSSNPGREP